MRAKVKFTVKIAVCESLRRQHRGGFDYEFDFDSHEWSCSKMSDLLHTAFVTVNLTLTLKSGVALRAAPVSRVKFKYHAQIRCM